MVMEELLNLLALCVLMFCLTLLVGCLPMFMKLPTKYLEWISIFGSGFLLGTALIVIVPEGLSILMEGAGVFEAGHHSLPPSTGDDGHSHSHSRSHAHAHAHTHSVVYNSEDRNMLHMAENSMIAAMDHRDHNHNDNDDREDREDREDHDDNGNENDNTIHGMLKVQSNHKPRVLLSAGIRINTDDDDGDLIALHAHPHSVFDNVFKFLTMMSSSNNVKNGNGNGRQLLSSTSSNAMQLQPDFENGGGVNAIASQENKGESATMVNKILINDKNEIIEHNEFKNKNKNHNQHTHKHKHMIKINNKMNDHTRKKEHSHGSHGSHQHHHTHDPLIHTLFRSMGSIVCFGFVFMIIIEKVVSEYGGSHHHHHGPPSSSSSAHNHSHGGHGHRSTREEKMNLIKNKNEGMNNNINNTSIIMDQSDKNKVKNENNVMTVNDDHKLSAVGTHKNILWSFMIGLLAHAAIDGVALGAVSVNGKQQSLSILVFLALMAHKAPAAVSLTAFLKRKSHPIQEIRKKLCLFSLAAPVFALITYFLLITYNYLTIDSAIASSQNLNVLRPDDLKSGATAMLSEDDYSSSAESALLMMQNGAGADDDESSPQLLAYCLLFSGGTFLYVVTLHIIPEIKEWRVDNQNVLTWMDILLLVVGCSVPAFFEHSH